MKILGNSMRGLSLFHKWLLYRTCILSITLYRFPLWYFKSATLFFPIEKLRKMQWKAILWIIGAFYIFFSWRIEAIASLISIQLYLDKLSSRYQLRTASLCNNHVIKSFFEHYLMSDSIPHCLLLDNVTLKQRLKIKSSIIDINNHLIGIFPSFNLLHKELSSGFHLVDNFQNCFSFNTVDWKINNAKFTYL